MTNQDINKFLRKKMNQSISSMEQKFAWEDENILTYLTGSLPRLKKMDSFDESKNPEYIRKLQELSELYNSYNYFSTDKILFIENLEQKILEIKKLNPKWYGLYLDSVKYYIDLHRFCLINGEGGIGKSYFIFKLEEKLTSIGIDHLCIYGKFKKDLNEIDFYEIITKANSKEFVLIIDAFNELYFNAQNILLDTL